jgi:hypothetical protein
MNWVVKPVTILDAVRRVLPFLTTSNMHMAVMSHVTFCSEEGFFFLVVPNFFICS